MAGLELLYSSVVGSVACPEDALVCFVHWEIVRSGYRCLGTGDQAQKSDKKSELLPAGWNSSREIYTLRYQSTDDKSQLLVKAITVDSTLIFNILNTPSEKVSDLTVNVIDYINADNLHSFDSVFRSTDELSRKVQENLLPWTFTHKAESRGKEEKNQRETLTRQESGPDPLRIPPRRPQSAPQPSWPDPLAPFAAGGEDLDPFGPDPDHMPPPGSDDMFM